MLMNLKGDQQQRSSHLTSSPLLPWTFYLYAALELMDIMNVQWSNEILSTDVCTICTHPIYIGISNDLYICMS